MAITAADVQKLRQATGAGMMDAKKALTEANGDFDAAVEILRVSGLAKAAKRSDRDAANGIVAAQGKAIIQLAAETDFVAKNADFVTLAQSIADAVDAAKVDGLDAAKALKLGDKTIEETISEFSGKIGEKMELVNAAYYAGTSYTYLHQRSQDLPPQVAVMVEYTGGDEAFAKSVAMHIAAMSPIALSREDIPAKLVENERHVAELTAKEEGKPEAIIPKIVEGRLNSYFKDNCLLEQEASYTDDKKTIGQCAKDAGAEITRFARFAVGA
ncbi:MAG: translation elongation factor Ts [Propionibacteriaceae bacterium]